MSWQNQAMWFSHDFTYSTTVFLGLKLRLKKPWMWMKRLKNYSDTVPHGKCEKESKRECKQNSLLLFIENFFYRFLTFLNISFPVSLILSTKHFIIQILNNQSWKNYIVKAHIFTTRFSTIVTYFWFKIFFLGINNE